MSEVEIWLRRKDNNFPRQVSMKRILVNSEVDLIKRAIIMKQNYVNIFSEYQRDNNIFETMFIDIDEHSKDLDFSDRMNILLKKVDILNKYLEKEDLTGRWYFTGNGFHCYIDYPDLVWRSRRLYSKTIRNFWYEIIEKELQKDIIDFNVLGDSNRLARFVGTTHPKTNMKMIRIDINSELSKIIENSINGKSFGDEVNWKDKNSWLNEYLITLQKDIKDVGAEANSQINIELKGLDLPPCIRQGIELILLTGELEHGFRLHLGSYLLKIMDRKLVENIFSFTNDYNPNITNTQLNSLENYNPYSCKNAAFHGICPYGLSYRRCPYYHLTSGWLARLFKS